jgi:ABC-type sugar transport system ATPase subunit
MTRRGGRVIRLEGLSKRYGDTRAVDSLDLTVSPGRVTARNHLVAMAQSNGVAAAS